MSKQIEEILFFDPQDVRPVGFCPVCGGEVYSMDGICLRCERRSQ